jgi:hypothetical protein
MIVESSCVVGAQQPDGRYQIKASLLDDEGLPYSHEWLGDPDFADAVLTEVAARFTRLIAERREAARVAADVKLPLTKFQFRSLLEQQGVLEGIDEFNDNYKSLGLSNAQVRTIRTGLKHFDAMLNVARPFDARVKAMLTLYKNAGLMTQANLDAVLEAGNG